MMKLVFLVCAIAQPDRCEQREIPTYEEIAPVACMMAAGPTLAQWRETHPDWRIARWRCEGEERLTRTKG